MTKSPKKRKAIPGRLPLDKAARVLLEEKVARTWSRDLEGMISFCERLQAIDQPEADAWARGQAEYFYRRIALLLEVTPDGCEGKAAAFRRRLGKLTKFKP